MYQRLEHKLYLYILENPKYYLKELVKLQQMKEIQICS